MIELNRQSNGQMNWSKIIETYVQQIVKVNSFVIFRQQQWPLRCLAAASWLPAVLYSVVTW